MKPELITNDLDMAAGSDADYVEVNIAPHAFTTDFAKMLQTGQQPKALLRSRVSIPPFIAKRFIVVLQNMVAQYEAQWGAIKDPGDVQSNLVVVDMNKKADA